MKTKLLISLVLIGGLSCSKVPILNRKQLNLLPESQLISMSLTNYQDFLQTNPPLPASESNAQLVTRVGQKVSSAVDLFMRQNKMADRIKGYNWEFNTVSNPQVNAWCMPGGKIVVYTGLLPITQDEASLAAVIGHEIGHAIARHGNERMSQMLVAETGGIALDVATANKSEQTRTMFQTAYGIGTTVGAILPYSRLQETEADKLGLIFMAMAGYDPSVAIGLWQRMSKAGGSKPPEMLSTHPSDETRIKNIRNYLPTAMKYKR